MQIGQRLRAAANFGEIFGLVKEAVYGSLGRRRAGLMLGLQPLGFSKQGFIGAYHQMGSNMIVLNESLLWKLRKERPDMIPDYVFVLLTHEYLHSLGVMDELTVRVLTERVAEETFGERHPVTKIAKHFEEYLGDMKEPENYRPPGDPYITLVDRFEQDDTRYIG